MINKDHHWVVFHIKQAQPPSLLPLFPPPAQPVEDIFATAKGKLNPKALRRRRTRNQKVGQMRTSLAIQTIYIFGDLPAAAKTKTKKGGMK